MFVEEITRIRNSEAKADEIYKDSKADAKKILRDAKSEADKLIADAEVKAKDIYDGFVHEGQEEADREYDKFLADKKNESAELIKKARNNEDKAVELIAERIVRDSVDS